MKKVFKYGTGQEVPEGAQYLCTKTEEQYWIENHDDSHMTVKKSNALVWHYFLVEVKSDQ